MIEGGIERLRNPRISPFTHPRPVAGLTHEKAMPKRHGIEITD